MRIARVVLSLLIVAPSTWFADWAWGLPLVVLTVVFHVFGLLFINEGVDHVQRTVVERHSHRVVFVVIIGAAALLTTILHGIEAGIWAAAYRLLDALHDIKSAVLYSLSAMTSYGHANLVLEKQWQLMGALESLNGMLLFGLTTAFLFGMIQRVWQLQSGSSH